MNVVSHVKTGVLQHNVIIIDLPSVLILITDHQNVPKNTSHVYAYTHIYVLLLTFLTGLSELSISMSATFWIKHGLDLFFIKLGPGQNIHPIFTCKYRFIGSFIHVLI